MTNIRILLRSKMVASLLAQTLSDLNTLGIRPSKKLGQNFLIDGNIVAKLAKDVKPGDVIVEIGPGVGAISEKILRAGGNLFAVEVDGRLATFLKEKFSNYKNFHLIQEDAVKSPLADAKNQDLFVISNLPYAISSAWFDALLNCENLPNKILLIVQKDFAERFFAKKIPSDICPISIFVQSAYEEIFREKISNKSFFPEPEVSSVIVSMQKKSDFFVFKHETKAVIRKIFTKRRKQIFSIINGEDNRLQKWLIANTIERNSRPEQISIQQWQNLDTFF